MKPIAPGTTFRVRVYSQGRTNLVGPDTFSYAEGMNQLWRFRANAIATDTRYRLVRIVPRTPVEERIREAVKKAVRERMVKVHEVIKYWAWNGQPSVRLIPELDALDAEKKP